jgi:hypothetical protein
MWFTGKRKASEEHLTALRNMDYGSSYRSLINKNRPRDQ